MPVVVLDTNILISALLSLHSKPYRCVDLARIRSIRSITCKEILDELKDKLSGKLKYLALSSEAVAEEIVSFSEVIAIANSLQGISVDPKDNMVIECAVVGGATHIITGDKRHLLPLISYQGITIVSASDFLRLFDEVGN